MKKIMMMAMMMVASATAFAGDSDGLKAILKAKTYDEASQLLKQNLASLADNAEKAKAYNHLVDLAMKQVDKESVIILANQVPGQTPKDYDTLSLCDGVVKSIDAAIECDKYDQLPNAKGKIAPKFSEKNAKRVWVNRFPHLVTYGDALRLRGNKEEALRLWNCFITSSTEQLFADQNKAADDEYRSQIAYLAGRTAADINKIDEANKYYEIALKDPKWNTETANFLIIANKSNIKTPEDTVKYVNYLTSLSKEYPNTELFFSGIMEIVLQQNNVAEAIKIADERIAKYPELEMAYAYKGQIYMNEKKYDDAISMYSKIKEDVKSPLYANCLYNSAVCKWNKASDFLEANSDVKTGRMTPENESKFMAMLKDAQIDFEKLKEIDPTQKNYKWGYLLRNIYLKTNQQEKADAIQ